MVAVARTPSWELDHAVYGAASFWGGGYDLGWSGPAPVTGAWHYYTLTYNGSRLAKVYADGKLKSQQTVPADLSSLAGLPIRIGVNAGSLDPAMAEKHGGITPEALVASAMHELDLFHEVDFDNVKISKENNKSQASGTVGNGSSKLQVGTETGDIRLVKS